jgi:hypothetical protein
MPPDAAAGDRVFCDAHALGALLPKRGECCVPSLSREINQLFLRQTIWLAVSFLRGFLTLVQIFDPDGFFLLDAHGDMRNTPHNRHVVRVLECPDWFAGVRIRNQGQDSVFQLTIAARIARAHVQEVNRTREMRLARSLREGPADVVLLYVDLHERAGNNERRHCEGPVRPLVLGCPGLLRATAAARR